MRPGRHALLLPRRPPGSVRALSDAKPPPGTHQYDAYGATTASTGSLTNPFRYAGGYRDAESGVDDLQARYYDPYTQQFRRRPLGSR